ncbi:MAG: 5'-nucleotidase C-terminal domain-containing protein, partial [Bacteroidota bacterium]
MSDEKKAWKVGILSVCLDANQKDFVHYEDVYQSARDQYKLLKETYEVDFVIALTHLSIEEDRKLAEEIPDLKLIMGGHEHENHYETVGEVPIAKADANAKSAWIHRFDYDAATDQLSVKSELVLMNEGVTEDTAIVREVSRWEEDIFTAFQAQGIDPKAEVCALETPLDGLERNIRTQQTNLGQAIAQAMHACYPTADAAIFNGGSVRIDDKLEGDITEYDILRALPFGGSVWQVKMEGSLLRKVLEMGEVNKGSGGYLQYDRIQKVGDEWQIGGTTLVPEESYDVAISDFLMSGREKNLDFLTSENTQVGEIRKPEEGDKARDIRIAF